MGVLYAVWKFSIEVLVHAVKAIFEWFGALLLLGITLVVSLLLNSEASPSMQGPGNVSINDGFLSTWIALIVGFLLLSSFLEVAYKRFVSRAEK